MPSHSAWYIVPCAILSDLGTRRGTYMRRSFLFITPLLSTQHSGGVERAPEAIPSMNRPIRDETERRQDSLETWTMSGHLVERT